MIKKIVRNDLIAFINPNIGIFHKKRIDKINKLKLKEILKRKNPYLFKAKNIITAGDLVQYLLLAYLSSQEETIFGQFLEELAIFICEKSFYGKKSAAQGIDLEFEREEILYIVSIKSGPNWGNSSQINKMRDNFKKAEKILRTNVSKQKRIIAVNGCCYGIDRQSDKMGYYKYCGQKFWELISGDSYLYIEIIEPLGYKAKEKDEAFMKEYAKTVNMFTGKFIEDYCNDDGVILWEKLVKYNSQHEK